MFYAQLNDDNICVGISELSSEVKDEYMINIDNFDTTLINKKYINGEWIESEDTYKQVSQQNEPTQLDRIEGSVSKVVSELRQEGYDNCVLDLMNKNLI